MLLPSERIGTTQWAIENRYIKGRDEQKARWRADLTPYVIGIQDACDMAGVRVVAVKGNARSGKTVGFENHALKRMQHGPYGDMFWYMQSKDDVLDYMEERGEWMLENHEEIAQKVDTLYRRNARDRKRIGASLARWMAATAKTTRGKGAPLIIADEIDAYAKKIMKGILTLLMNRQREFGSAALLLLASHPDAAPFGIEAVLQQSRRHLWWWLCPYRRCREASSPAAEAPIRMNWNLSELLKITEDIEYEERLAVIAKDVRLICPHCGKPIDNDMRLEMSAETGTWVQPQQKLVGPKQVSGAHVVDKIMGFAIHGFMTPFVDISEAAHEFTTAKLEFDDTRDDTQLKEVTVKTLGEAYKGAEEKLKIDNWKTVKNRMTNGGSYLLRTVPRGVHFLTAFVDVQGDRFEVRVIGWSQARESWLIDAFSLREWHSPDDPERNLENLAPFQRLADWSILEDAVLHQSYPLVDRPAWHLPIAKMAIDQRGFDEEGQNNAREWAANAINRDQDPIPEWQVLLHAGSRHKTGELYGIPKQVMKDDRGRVMESRGVWERYPNVHKIKRLIASRMQIQSPGPGFMHAPMNLRDHYFRELTAESLVNDEWLTKGRNETWDGWVACETARASLQPERQGLDFEKAPPVWARPFRPGLDAGIDAEPRKLVSQYARLAALNADADGEDDE